MTLPERAVQRQSATPPLRSGAAAIGWSLREVKLMTRPASRFNACRKGSRGASVRAERMRSPAGIAEKIPVTHAGATGCAAGEPPKIDGLAGGQFCQPIGAHNASGLRYPVGAWRPGSCTCRTGRRCCTQTCSRPGPSPPVKSATWCDPACHGCGIRSSSRPACRCRAPRCCLSCTGRNPVRRF